MNKIFIISLIFYSCASTTATKQASVKKEENENWIVSVKKQYETEEPVSIEIKNKTDVSLTVLDPFEKRIEMYQDDEWKKVGVLYCDCNPCPAPPESFSISTDETHNFFWDRVQEKCEQGKIKKEKASPGKYRVVFRYLIEGTRDVKKLMVEFLL